MATDDPGTPTPAKVAELATERARLPRRALIGIFGSTTAPGALVRTENGAIARVTVGDSVNGDLVTAIGPDSVILAARGGNDVLRLPRG